jgi:hypothetical protein
MAEEWQLEEMVQGRETIRVYSGMISELKKENAQLKRDLENTRVLLNLCLEKLTMVSAWSENDNQN